MNKSDLITTLEGRMKHLSKKEIELVVNTLFDKMTDALATGGRIEIRGFGSFEVRTREPRQGRNPKTGASVYVNTRKVPFFKVGKELKERINTGGQGGGSSA